MHVRIQLTGLAALAVCAVLGCASNRYEIELSPSGEALQRDLTAWRIGSAGEGGEQKVIAFPGEELARIAGEYGAAPPAARAKKHRFSGVFSERMPNDVGGHGSYFHWQTPLGTTSGYVERFRGSDDLAASLERRQAAAEAVVDVLAGYLKSKLEDAEGYDQLEKFLQDEFRRDVRNLSLYSWTMEISSHGQEQAAVECAVRCGQYLAERSYFEPQHVPAIFRALQEAEADENPEVILTAIQRFLACKMGLPNRDLIPASLKFLADATGVEESFMAYIRKTDGFRARLAQWQQQRGKSDQKRPSPAEFFGDLMTEAFLPGFGLAPADRLDVKLAARRQPFQTNGDWLEEESKIHWSRKLNEAPAVGYPAVLYAFWSVPEEAAQQARFGRVILEGETLANYCVWRKGLTAGEGRQWDGFVDRLKPGPQLGEQIGGFRLLGHQDAEGPSLLGRELLLSGLAPEEAEEE